MLVESTVTKPFEIDDLHPGGYRCAKNSNWAAPVTPPLESTPSDILRDIAHIAAEIKLGVGVLMRQAGLELPPRSAHIPAEDYDLYPCAYKAMKNAEPVHVDPTTATVHHLLTSVKDTISTALARLQERAQAIALPTEEEEEEDEGTTDAEPADVDLYPRVARAYKNRPYDSAAHLAHAQHSLGEELVSGLQHTVQDLRRKWVHVQAERAAKDQLDLYPDAYRYCKNHNLPPSPTRIASEGPAKTINDFFDTLSAIVAAAAA